MLQAPQQAASPIALRVTQCSQPQSTLRAPGHSEWFPWCWLVCPLSPHTHHHPPLVHPHNPSASVAILLQGATITRWIDEVGKNLLFVRPDAVFEPGRAIK